MMSFGGCRPPERSRTLRHILMGRDNILVILRLVFVDIDLPRAPPPQIPSELFLLVALFGRPFFFVAFFGAWCLNRSRDRPDRTAGGRVGRKFVPDGGERRELLLKPVSTHNGPFYPRLLDGWPTVSALVPYQRPSCGRRKLFRGFAGLVSRKMASSEVGSPVPTAADC